MKKLLPVFVFLGLLAMPRDAHAYLDPASGSMILQLLLGGVAGAAVILRLFWGRILGFFGIHRDEHEHGED